MAPSRPTSPLGERVLTRAAEIEDIHAFLNRLLPLGNDEGLNPSSSYSIIRYFCSAPCHPSEPQIGGVSMPLIWRDLRDHLRDVRSAVAKAYVRDLLAAIKKITMSYHETKLLAFINNLRNTPITLSRDWTRTFSVSHAFMVERLWDTYTAARAALMIAIDAVVPGVVPPSEIQRRPTCPVRIPDYSTGGLASESREWATADLGWSGSLKRASPWLADWVRQFAESASNVPPPTHSRSSNARGRGSGPGRGRGRWRGRRNDASRQSSWNTHSTWTSGQSPSSSSSPGPAYTTTGPRQPPTRRPHQNSPRSSPSARGRGGGRGRGRGRQHDADTPRQSSWTTHSTWTFGQSPFTSSSPGPSTGPRQPSTPQTNRDAPRGTPGARGRGRGHSCGRSHQCGTGASRNSTWTFEQSPFTSSSSTSSQAGPATGPGQPPPQQSHRQSRSRRPSPPSPTSPPSQQHHHQPPPPPPP